MRVAEVGGRQEVTSLLSPDHVRSGHAVGGASQRHIGTFASHLVAARWVIQNIWWHYEQYDKNILKTLRLTPHLECAFYFS